MQYSPAAAGLLGKVPMRGYTRCDHPGELAQRGDVLALTFHVDYWDDLGWRDRFGLPESVQRQRSYANALQLSSVFTPQVVVDGRDSFVGSDRIGIGRALSETRTGVAVSPIGRGENAGRTIQEFNIVRGFHRPGPWDGKSRRYQARVDSLPSGASNVAILVQPVGQAPIIGAATVALGIK
jgi:hypothetical protein